MTKQPKPRAAEGWVHHLHNLAKRFILGIEELVEMGVLTSQLDIGLPSRIQVTFDNKELISFIRSLLSRREREVREKVTKEILGIKTSKIYKGYPDCGSHNGMAECCQHDTIDKIVEKVRGEK